MSTKGLERKCHAQVGSFVKVPAIDMCVDRTVWRLYKVPCHERFSQDAIILTAVGERRKWYHRKMIEKFPEVARKSLMRHA